MRYRCGCKRHLLGLSRVGGLTRVDWAQYDATMMCMVDLFPSPRQDEAGATSGLGGIAAHPSFVTPTIVAIWPPYPPHLPLLWMIWRASFAARRQALFDASDEKEESADEQAPVDEQAPKLLPLLRDPIKDVTNPQRRCSLQSCRAPRDPRSP